MQRGKNTTEALKLKKQEAQMALIPPIQPYNQTLPKYP